jgi:hypothetical protein
MRATIALFTVTRADTAFDELSELVAKARPDVIVAEMWDYVAPLVAQQLGIPWVTLVHSPATPVDSLLAGGMSRAASQRELATPTPLATVQLWPEWFESEQAVPGSEPVMPIGTAPYNTSTPEPTPW